MEKFVDTINKHFSSAVSNDFINNKTKNSIKLRNRKDGLHTYDAVNYLFSCSYIHKSKTTSTRELNRIIKDETKKSVAFHRTAYYKKEKHIPLSVYEKIHDTVDDLCKPNLKKDNDYTINGKACIGVDGCNNNNTKDKSNKNANVNVCLNMGFYDISHNFPLDLTSEGSANRNKEIEFTIKYIKSHLHSFKNLILVGDRFYFGYEFLKFLIDNHISFIVRCKGDAKYLDDLLNNNNKTNKKDLINAIKPKVKIFRFTETYKRTVFSKKTKNNKSHQYTYDIKNDCNIVTNLKNVADDVILKIYRKRWDIETFFKLVKANFNFSNIHESNKIQIQKQNLCILTVIKLAKFFQNYYLSNYKQIDIKDKRNGKSVTCTVKVNECLLIEGLMNDLIRKMLMGKLNVDDIEYLLKNNIEIIKNELDRKFPRQSITPYTKWNIKGYSINSQTIQVLEAIINDNINDLNKNLKLMASRISNIKKSEIT